jgi:hypothetical protein
MAQSVMEPVVQKAPASKSEKAHRYLNIVSTAFGICGAVGTLAVWGVANWYVGDVEMQADKPLESIVVKVYDNKGHEAQFRTPKFQVMPGDYHVEVTANGGKAQLLETHVEYGKKTVMPIVVLNEQEKAVEQTAEMKEASEHKKHWWRFWR